MTHEPFTRPLIKFLNSWRDDILESLDFNPTDEDRIVLDTLNCVIRYIKRSKDEELKQNRDD